MVVMTLLKDFNKSMSDILKSSKFGFNNTVEVKADQDNVFSWSAKQTTKESELVFTQTEKDMGKLKCTFNTVSNMKIEAETTELSPVSLLKATVESEKAEVSAKYDDESFSGKLTVEAQDAKYKFVPEITFAPANDFLFGAKVDVDCSGAVNDYQLGMLYCSGDNQKLAVQTSKKFDKLCVGGYLQESPLGQVCLQVDACNLMNEKEATKTDFSFGGLYKCDSQGTLRWKGDVTKQSLGLVYEYKFRSNVKGCFGTSVNVASQTVSPLDYKIEMTL